MALISMSIVQAFPIKKKSNKNWELDLTITVISITAWNTDGTKTKDY